MYKALIVMIYGIDPDVKHLVFIWNVQKIKYVYPLAAMLFGKDALAAPFWQAKTIWLAQWASYVSTKRCIVFIITTK